MLCFLVAAAVLAPNLAPHDPIAVSLADRLKPPFFAGGTMTFPLGTDGLGQDILSRIIYGARISLLIGFTVITISGIIGITLGVIAGYAGGIVDDVIMRIADIQLAFPAIILYIAVMAVIGPGLRNIIIVMGIVGWVAYARIERGQVLQLRDQDFIMAARSVGVPSLRIVLRHILPNAWSPIIVVTSFSLASTIITESSLSFLGLGVPPSVPTWGAMLASGRDYLRQAWWLATLPGLAIALTVLAINLIGDWLRDYLDPRLRL
ncbi:MAG: ABC transporter permease [Caldilineaceae bacterium]|nr:ABC transporter permease [Caldilineaceae bacterium]